MRSLIYILFFIPLLINAQLSKEQEIKIDSLKQIIEIAKHDSLIVNAYVEWDNIIYNYDPDLDLELNIKIDEICTKNLEKKLKKNELSFFKIQKASALNNKGLIYNDKGDYEESIDFLNKSLSIREELKDTIKIAGSLNNLGNTYLYMNDYKNAIFYYNKCIELYMDHNDKYGMASSLGNVGTIFRKQGNYKKAIEYYTKSLTTYEEIGFEDGIGNTLGNIGLIYNEQGEYSKALEYIFRALELKEKTGDILGINNAYLNIGTIYYQLGQYEDALGYFNKALELSDKIGSKANMANSLNNLGIVYREKGIHDKAIEYFKKSLVIEEEINNIIGRAVTLDNIGATHLNQGNYQKAIEYCSKSLFIAKEFNQLIPIKDASKTLYKAYKYLGKYKQALNMYELYIASRDSILSEENQKEIIRQEYKYDYEKQAAADSVKNAEAQKVKDAQLAVQKAENEQYRIKSKQQRQQAYFLYGGLAIALIFGGFIFNRYKITNKQKGIITEQKKQVDDAYDELEEKNRDIMDSITYAKRIQSAILPPNKVVKEYLKDSFILYKPKDIVAGDFYWMEHSDGKILFAAADCTGHGVPGAMVSVVCNNGLNRAVREHGLTDPGQILDKTREIVIQEFEKSEEEVKDGMDIALCSLEGNKLQYAGAHNPLWIIRNGKILEIRPDRQPIGMSRVSEPFTTHTIELQKGDTLYIFTDGYVDQFGGEKAKKFKSKAFKELLLSIQDKTMEDQRLLLDESFETWKGKLEQIDDVCIIGVRI